MLVRALAFLACAAFASTPLNAHGEGPSDVPPLTVALEYAAPPECPEAADFKATVVGRLGYDAFRDDATTRVLVQLAPRSHGFEGRIEWRNAEGKWVGDRTFPSRSEDCRDLDRAMAFALALQIQLSAFTKAPPSPPPAEKSEVKPPIAPPIPPIASPPPVAKKPPPVWGVGAGGLVGFGMSSSAIPLARLFGTVAWTHFSLELAAEAGWPTTIRRADGAGFSQRHLLAGVAGCGLLGAWSSCMVAKAGEVLVSPKDVDMPSSPSGAIVQAGLRLAFTQALGRHVFIAGHADGLVNVIQWTVTLDNLPVWSAPRFAADIGLDAGVRFP